VKVEVQLDRIKLEPESQVESQLLERWRSFEASPSGVIKGSTNTPWGTIGDSCTLQVAFSEKKKLEPNLPPGFALPWPEGVPCPPRWFVYTIDPITRGKWAVCGPLNQHAALGTAGRLRCGAGGPYWIEPDLGATPPEKREDAKRWFVYKRSKDPHCSREQVAGPMTEAAAKQRVESCISCLGGLYWAEPEIRPEPAPPAAPEKPSEMAGQWIVCRSGPAGTGVRCGMPHPSVKEAQVAAYKFGCSAGTNTYWIEPFP
jgi:hypothetical protein